MILKHGSRGDAVIAIQEKFGIKRDGIFGSTTENAVRNFQQDKGLKIDGIVGPKTLDLLDINLEEFLTTDIQDSAYTTEDGLVIHKSYLDKPQYLSGPTDKFYVFLHHTAGGHNPYSTIRFWNNDTRGRIATQFVIGNTSIKGDTTHDGKVVECFPDNGWAYHLGDNNNPLLHPHSIGIEICNYGWLDNRGGKFYTYVNHQLPEEQVLDLGFMFRGHRYYHKYTGAQIKSVYYLLQEISKRHPQVNLTLGLSEWLELQSPAEAFDFKDEAYDGNVRGLLTHCNTRRDKTDCSPQPLLVEMLRNIK